MPLYVWECMICKHEFTLFKAMGDNNVDCIACGTSGYETMVDRYTGHTVHKVRKIMQRVNVINSLSSSEGRVNEAVDMSVALGEEARNITSRRQLREVKKKTRERIYKKTDGRKKVMKQFVDAGTGKVYEEEVTNEVSGFDIGEIHRVEEPGKNEIQSAFEPGETREETERKLEKRLSS